MKAPALGVNVTLFLLFFGVAALEAFQKHHWTTDAFWVAIGVAFLLADNLRGSRPPSAPR